MVCWRSNKKNGNNLIVRIWLDATAEIHVDALAAWVTKAAHMASPTGAHPAVGGTVFNDFKCSEYVQNCVDVAVHASPTFSNISERCEFDGDNLIIVKEAEADDKVFDANRVCGCLTSCHREEAHAFSPHVLAVGVSAVSGPICAEWWNEIVEPYRGWMDGMGKGNSHRQHMYTAELGAWCVRETSKDFQW